MFGNILTSLGLRKQHRSFFSRRGSALAPVGGVIPLAYLAWRNRDKISGAYNQYVAPKLHRKQGLSSQQQSSYASSI